MNNLNNNNSILVNIEIKYIYNNNLNINNNNNNFELKTFFASTLLKLKLTSTLKKFLLKKKFFDYENNKFNFFYKSY